MRYIDLAVAALIGVSSVTGVIAWTPAGGDAAARQAEAQVRLRDGLLELLQQHGTSWFLGSPLAVCSFIARASNSSYGLFATFGGASCGSPPPRGSVSAALTLDLVPLEVNLVAWSSA